METTLILDYILIFFSIVIGTLLSGVLYRTFIILGKVEKTINYIDHIRDIFESWEQIPFAIIAKITSLFSNK